MSEYNGSRHPFVKLPFLPKDVRLQQHARPQWLGLPVCENRLPGKVDDHAVIRLASLTVGARQRRSDGASRNARDDAAVMAELLVGKRLVSQLHGPLACDVEVAGGLVQERQARVSMQGARQDHPLLSTRAMSKASSPNAMLSAMLPANNWSSCMTAPTRRR